ncbi:CapA family protein [Wukongibacter baidiensis]|uniref:CapA family protein n=1 Tax=Wukongibacter baidiensis TaxID=1723361 RepID=UPI003D7F3711
MKLYLLILITFFNSVTTLFFSPHPYNISKINDIQIVSSSIPTQSTEKSNRFQNSKQHLSLKNTLQELEDQKKYIKEREKQRKRNITISFAGDCTIGYDENFPYTNSFPFVLEKQMNNYAYFFSKVKPIFEKDDLTLVNLETTFTAKVKKANKKFRFKGDPSYVNILKEGDIEMVNISNNHIYDYLHEGFLETIDTLKKADVLYSGEGYIEYYTVKDITIASIGYRGWSTNIKPHLAKDIKEAKEKASIVIVSFHWGNEYTYYPNQTQISLGRFTIDEGADVVVGHHPHVMQGIEKYKEKYIVYSLGNFSFGGNKNPRDKDTFIFQNKFTLIDKKIIKSKENIIPCSLSSVKDINNYQPDILKDSEKERVLKRIYKYSRNLKYGITQID